MADERKYALEGIFGPGYDAMTQYTPHAQYLGLKVVETGRQYAVMMLPYRPEIVGDPFRKVVFGGAITTLLDHTSGLCVACSLENLAAIATIDLRVDYLRAAEPGRDLYARTDCFRVTRTVAFVRGHAWDQDPSDPFATSIGAFMIGSTAIGGSFNRLVEEGESK
jgi:uncharacterized protein (TIGR00369 family)